MFHVELRQFPGVARAFNLTRSELERRLLAPWIAGRPVRFNEREFSPAKAKLLIYEGDELATEELGLGRGWGLVTQRGEDVTARVLAEASSAAVAPVRELKEAIVVAAARPGGASLASLVALAPGRRASERLAACETAVWELLHAGRLGLARRGAQVSREQWEETLLAWDAETVVVSG